MRGNGVVTKARVVVGHDGLYKRIFYTLKPRRFVHHADSVLARVCDLSNYQKTGFKPMKI